jgi:hypothetical protein
VDTVWANTSQAIVKPIEVNHIALIVINITRIQKSKTILITPLIVIAVHHIQESGID